MFSNSFSHFVLVSELVGEGDVLIYPNHRPVKLPFTPSEIHCILFSHRGKMQFICLLILSMMLQQLKFVHKIHVIIIEKTCNGINKILLGRISPRSLCCSTG